MVKVEFDKAQVIESATNALIGLGIDMVKNLQLSVPVG